MEYVCSSTAQYETQLWDYDDSYLGILFRSSIPSMSILKLQRVAGWWKLCQLILSPYRQGSSLIHVNRQPFSLIPTGK